jgi:hypothetical protein
VALIEGVPPVTPLMVIESPVSSPWLGDEISAGLPVATEADGR